MKLEADPRHTEDLDCDYFIPATIHSILPMGYGINSCSMFILIVGLLVSEDLAETIFCAE